MTLETLKNINRIGIFDIMHFDENINVQEYLESKAKFIFINHFDNYITLRIQKGTIKESGINGIQIDEMLTIFFHILIGLNKNLPCYENYLAIENIKEAITHLQMRRMRRVKKGIEGTNQEKYADDIKNEHEGKEF